ncbi:MAG TPA: EF-P lysine aminoacylase EpmA [Syntrophales bacterium]|nr:EF-P lysine aminoacylase EpmA [Syntrophales bacterium]
MSADWKFEVRHQALEIRACVLHAIRAFFLSRDYLEVETPNRIPAPLPESHIDAVPAGEWSLHPSPELCMKRMLASGYERIFQISKCYREHERGPLHLPEFSLLEWYHVGYDYIRLMDQCEDLFLYVSEALGKGNPIQYRNREIDLLKPWERLSVKESFERYGSVAMEKALLENRFEEILALEIEPRLGIPKPTFLCDYPLAFGSLARARKDNPTVAERFEIYIGGLELANGFSELTDADEQRNRFRKENDTRVKRGRSHYPMPEKFLDAVSHMPESAGIALGVDRLVMLFADAVSIDEVVSFTPEEL